MTINNKYLDTLNRLGWNVTKVLSDGSLTLEKYSPAGEDYCFVVYADSLVEDVGNEAGYFDVDEHVMELADKRGQGGVPNTIQELLDDAKAIRDMLNELADALEEAEAEAEVEEEE